MRRFSMILLLLGMLLVMGIVGAQEEETILYVRLECDCETDSILDEIVSQLEANLAPHNIRLQIARPADESSEYVGWSDFVRIQLQSYPEAEVNGEQINSNYFFYYVLLSPTQDRRFAEISPLLNSHISAGSIIDLGLCNFDYRECDYQTDILAVMALYLINRCDLLEDYANLIVENRGESYLSLIAKAYQANCAILAGDYVRAQALFEVIPWFMTNYGGLNAENLAWLYIQNNQANKAFELMSDWLEITRDTRPRSKTDIGIIYVLKLRAQIYALAFDYDNAIADMDEAIALAERSQSLSYTLPELYTIRGEIIFLIYEWDRVLENFNHAIELDPNYAPAYFQRGVLYYTMTQRENALADFERYLELEPDGLYGEEAAQYIESIQIELDALGG